MKPDEALLALKPESDRRWKAADAAAAALKVQTEALEAEFNSLTGLDQTTVRGRKAFRHLCDVKHPDHKAMTDEEQRLWQFARDLDDQIFELPATTIAGLAFKFQLVRRNLPRNFPDPELVEWESQVFQQFADELAAAAGAMV